MSAPQIQYPPTSGGGAPVGGSGTTNYIPRWNPGPSTLGDSRATDDGTTFVVGSGAYAGTALPGGMQLKTTVPIYVATDGTRTTIIGTDGTTSCFVGSLTNHNFQIRASNATAITVQPAGNVGIGTASPNKKFQVLDSASGEVRFTTTANVVGNTITQRFSSNAGAGAYEGGGAYIQAIQGSGIDVWSLAFGTANLSATAQERVRIDSSGNVGIGTASPLGKLNVENGTAFVGSSANTSQTNNLLNGYGYRIGSTLYGNVSIRSTYDNTTNAASLEFYTSPTGTTTTERARIDSAGRVLVGTSTAPSSVSVGFVQASTTGGMQWQNGSAGGCAVLPSANTATWYVHVNAMGLESYTLSHKAISTGLDVSTAGYGVKLPATPDNTNPNTIDCYVDGGTAGSGGATFTATLKGSVSDPTTPVTATGQYLRVGKQVTISIDFASVDTTGASGNVYIETNLSTALNPAGVRIVAPVLLINSTFTGSPIASLTAATRIDLYTIASNSALGFVTHNAGAGRRFTVTVTYIIA